MRSAAIKVGKTYALHYYGGAVQAVAEKYLGRGVWHVSFPASAIHDSWSFKPLPSPPQDLRYGETIVTDGDVDSRYVEQLWEEYEEAIKEAKIKAEKQERSDKIEKEECQKAIEALSEAINEAVSEPEQLGGGFCQTGYRHTADGLATIALVLPLDAAHEIAEALKAVKGKKPSRRASALEELLQVPIKKDL